MHRISCRPWFSLSQTFSVSQKLMTPEALCYFVTYSLISFISDRFVCKLYSLIWADASHTNLFNLVCNFVSLCCCQCSTAPNENSGSGHQDPNMSGPQCKYVHCTIQQSLFFMCPLLLKQHHSYVHFTTDFTCLVVIIANAKTSSRHPSSIAASFSTEGLGGI